MVKFVPKRNTEKIAIVATTSAIAASMGAFLLEFAPHTVFIEKYKKILQLYRLADGVPINNNVQKLYDSVLDDLKLKKNQREKLEPFTITGFDVYHAGLPSGRFKAIIGIPINYSYENKNSINTSDIRIGYDREPLNMHHPAAENLVDSLILSDKAKKFAIAREILMAHKDLPLYRSIESPVVLTASIFMAEYARMKFKVINKTWPTIVLAYGLSGLLGFAVWFQIRDNLNTYFEKAVDKEVAELGKDYVEGGKEYYEKTLKRNVALRTLLGKQGDKAYNRDGDEIFLIRHKRTPTTYRKKFFSEFLMEENVQQTV